MTIAKLTLTLACLSVLPAHARTNSLNGIWHLAATSCQPLTEAQLEPLRRGRVTLTHLNTMFAIQDDLFTAQRSAGSACDPNGPRIQQVEGDSRPLFCGQEVDYGTVEKLSESSYRLDANSLSDFVPVTVQGDVFSIRIDATVIEGCESYYEYFIRYPTS